MNVLTAFLRPCADRDISSLLDWIRNGEFYNFITDGINLTIEHVDDYDTALYYFNIKKYMEAVDIGFTDYLNKYEQKGKIFPPIEKDQFHPLNEEVLNYFYKFSALING